MDEQNNKELKLDEASILGNIFLDEKGEVMLLCTQHLMPEDFLDARNKEIFSCCLQAQQKGRKVDISSVTEELQNNKTYNLVGGLTYLQSVIDATVKIGPVEDYIATVKERSLLNRFLEKLDKILKNAKEQKISDVSEFIGKAADDILEISQQRRVAEAKGMDTITESLVAQLVKQTEDFKANGIQPNGVTGIPTGFEEVDKLTKGWHKGDMIVIGARPSVGKTAFALNLLYQVAKKGKPVVFFSLEMNAESIALRLLNLVSGLSSNAINSLEYVKGSTKDKLLINTAGDPEKSACATKLQKGMNELSKLPFYVDDTSGSKMLDISTKCQKLQNQIREIKKMDIGLIAIDYIGLITSPSKGNDNRQNEVAAISRQIKQMARDLQVPVIALTQLSRDSEKRDNHNPQMSDIRESGSIEQDADMVLMLYREDYYTKQQNINNGKDKNEQQSQPVEEDKNSPISQVKVNLIKNRNGSTGLIDFIFDKEHCMFSAVSDRGEEEF